MQWINDRRSYGWLSITLHWLAALSLLYMLWTGFNADWAEDAHNRVARTSFLALHVSFGLTVILILLARVAASYAQARPQSPEQSAPLKMLASATHQLLLLAVLVQIVTGPLMIWVMARPLVVWNWFSIPSPFKEPNHDLHEMLANVHDVGRWALVVMIGLHVLGALKHGLVDRDGSFQRILRPRSIEGHTKGLAALSIGGHVVRETLQPATTWRKVQSNGEILPVGAAGGSVRLRAEPSRSRNRTADCYPDNSPYCQSRAWRVPDHDGAEIAGASSRSFVRQSPQLS